MSRAKLTARDAAKSQEELHHARQKDNLLSCQEPVLCLSLPSSPAQCSQKPSSRAATAATAAAAMAAAGTENIAVLGCKVTPEKEAAAAADLFGVAVVESVPAATVVEAAPSWTHLQKKQAWERWACLLHLPHEMALAAPQL